LIGDFAEAEKAARETIKINPANEGAYSVLIQAMGDSKPLEKVIMEVPKSRRSLAQVMSAFSHVALKQGNYVEAIEWARKSLEEKTVNDKGVEIRLQLASALLESVLQGKSLAESEVLAGERKQRIEEAKDVFDGVWKDLENTQLKNFKVQCLANRSLANRILGNTDDALVDLDGALEIDSKNSQFILLKASLLFEKKDFTSAKKLLDAVLDKEESSPLLLSEILRSENKLTEAADILLTQLGKKHSESLEREFKRSLIDLYLQMEKPDKAEKLASTLDDTVPVNLASQASVLRIMGKKAGALRKLKKARDLIKDRGSSIELLSIAVEYYLLGKYEEAASFYSRLADISVDNFITRKLLECYYKIGNDEKTLEIVQTLRKKYGLVQDLTELESAIYEEIGDLQAAQKLCEEHLQHFPDDNSLKVRLAMVLFRQQKSKELDGLIKKGIDDSKLLLPKRIQLAQIYSLINKSFESIKVMYEARRGYYGKSEAHAKYIALFFSSEKGLDFTAPKVAVDTAVCIEDKVGHRQWYVIEDRKNADPHTGELNLSHPLAKHLIGKHIGDFVLLSSNNIQDQTGKIVELNSKYVHAVHESSEIFNKLFPGDKSFMSLSLDFSKQKKLPEEFIKMLDKDRENHKKVNDIYKVGKVTLAMLSSMLGRNVIDTWGYAVCNKDFGIKCAFGTIDERTKVSELLSPKEHFAAIDISAILTLHGLGLADVVANNFERLIVPHSTKDLLVEVIAMRKGIQSEGFMGVAKDNGSDKYLREEITKESIKKNTEYLESILSWVNEKCTDIPCKEALKINPNRKEMMFKTMGRSFVETVLLAKQEGVLFFSDDLWLRAIMKNEFGVEGIWSQAVLFKLATEEKLSKEDYEKALVKLVLSNYTYIPIGSDTLIEGASQAGWHSIAPFTDVVQIIGKGNTDIKSSLRVIEDFAVKLYTRAIYLPSFSELFHRTLDTAIPKFNRETISKILLRRLKRRLILMPSIFNNIEKDLNEWLRWQNI
jgi:tetratricopeptide (TPR) repeat protein